VETTRVDISYRPLRIGWAVQSGDLPALRQAMRLSHALWGGRFNPILVVDQENAARELVEAFHVDVIWPVSTTDTAQNFSKKFPHLIKPFFGNEIIDSEGGSQVLDLHNALAYLRDKPEWKAMRDEGVTLYSWAADDPLGDVFLMQLGDFPNPNEVKINYREMLTTAAGAKEQAIENGAVLPATVAKHRSIAFVSRFGVERRSDHMTTFYPGFYVGDASDFNDLVCHWNLRAADNPLWFIDRKHIARYSQLIPAWEQMTTEMLSWRANAWDRQLALWSCGKIEEDAKLFGEMPLLHIPVSGLTWNGLNTRVPIVEFDKTSVLGIVGTNGGTPRVSFAYGNKPFSDDTWFYRQHLVASISCISGLRYNSEHTLGPPFVPEFNEFYARAMAFDYSKLRSEPDRIGLVIDACDHDGFLDALPFGDLIAQIFRLAGYEAKLSSGGLIVRQLITRLDGLQGGRVFKIPGVRRLIKTYGPGTPFTKRAALQIIGQTDPGNPAVKFSDHEDLYIEQRPAGTKLTPSAVLGYLVDKGLFRIGAELRCPACRMASWTPLDQLKQQVVCELCGHEHNVTRQLVDAEWMFRRSGVLGAERHAQGAIPVAVALQQLEVTTPGMLGHTIYSPSLELTPFPGKPGTNCEIDLVWVMAKPRWDAERTVVILGECKDQWLIDDATIKHLREVADSLPRNRFEVFIILAKLCAFTPDEITRAKTLNNGRHSRVILLTARELEPYFIFERTAKECVFTERGHSPEDLAQVTTQIYFQTPAPISATPGKPQNAPSGSSLTGQS
jgi:hypothetical protein